MAERQVGLRKSGLVKWHYRSVAKSANSILGEDPRKQRKSSLSKNLLFSNWPTEGLTLLVMSTNSGNLGWFLFSDKNIKLKLRECGAIQAISYGKNMHTK